MGMINPDPRNHPPSAQTGEIGDKTGDVEQDAWLSKGRSAFYASTSYVDGNYRKVWEDSIRAFNNQHSLDSKYNAPAYEKRSRVFRPKTRSVIRKNEAAAAAAFFSNMDVVSVEAQDKTSKQECASAEIMKSLLQYRLTKTIPWYQIVLGGFQDAQVTGVACAHIYWEYRESHNEEQETTHEEEFEGDDTEYPEQAGLPLGTSIATGNGIDVPPQTGEQAAEPKATLQALPKPLVDRPVIDLIPVENIRIDPGADWIDPINSSPFVIELMPVYVLDIKERIASGEWNKVPDALLYAATETSADTTRITRNKNRSDPYDADNNTVDDYDIAWVQRHIHRKDGEDWEFYMLSDLALLTAPRLLSETVFHGKRPYVMGPCILETHKIYPTSIPQLGKGLQDEANEVTNQRLDNVKFVLNKKYFVKRGKEADIAGLVRNVPGGVVMLDDPQNDVKEMTWPDVTSSAFQEHQNINMELDELLGNFNPASIMATGGANSPARNMAMLSQSQGTLVEYLIRTYVETFVQPVLRQLVQLEQAYETDQVVLKIAAKQSGAFQKYGVNEVTDELLEQELTLTVNVGMGATDPMQKLNKFLSAMSTYTAMLAKPMPGIDMKEVGKEIFGHLGYSDGSRFMTDDNPQLKMLQMQLQQATQQVQQLTQQVQEKQSIQQNKLQVAKLNSETQLQKTKMIEEGANKRALATHFRELNAAAENKKLQVPPPPPPKPPEHKPPVVHIHIPTPPPASVVMTHPKRSRSRAERDANGEMLGSVMEHEY